MEKVIETLASLCIGLGDTTIKRLEDRYIVDSDYSCRGEYGIHYYDFLDAEVDLDGNILSASHRYGRYFYDDGSSEEEYHKLNDPDWEPINDNNVMLVVFERAEKILSLKPNEEIKITLEDCLEYYNRNEIKWGMK